MENLYNLKVQENYVKAMIFGSENIEFIFTPLKQDAALYQYDKCLAIQKAKGDKIVIEESNYVYSYVYNRVVDISFLK